MTVTPWWASGILFNTFRPEMGELTFVSMQFVGSFTQTVTLSVPAGVPAQTLSYFSSSLQPMVYAYGTPLGSSVPSPATSIRHPGVTMDPGTSQTFESSGLLSWSWDLMDYSPEFHVGLGTLRYSVESGIYTRFDNPGGLMLVDPITLSGGTFSMTYWHLPPRTPSSVPEPSTFALVGALLVAGGLAHRH
ncbi:MAG: PEP-CTERM sorting domain-containing protein [Bryobacterales bacterium]|nr:PEP-CTERM sorting domain-containing protein [Bryobacterales bacterium]